MKTYFIKTLGLSPKGASDLQKASFWVAVVNFILMGTSGMIFYFLQESLPPILNNETPEFRAISYVIFTILLLFFLFIAYYFAYNSSYLAAYSESAIKRITLAECLRKLPLSFFGKKDVSDITTTIMADVAELETSFSHYIPALFGSLASTLMISLGLFSFHWKMALATLWVVPVSLVVCLWTRKFQQKLSETAMSQRLDYDKKSQNVSKILKILRQIIEKWLIKKNYLFN